MKFNTPLIERKILSFTIVNYTAKAVFNVFLIWLLFAGFFVSMASNFIDFSRTSGLFLWGILTLVGFVCAMRYRDRCVRSEIDEGLHDPVWGAHIQRINQRKLDELHQSHWITRPLFKLACIIGIHKRK